MTIIQSPCRWTLRVVEHRVMVEREFALEGSRPRLGLGSVHKTGLAPNKPLSGELSPTSGSSSMRRPDPRFALPYPALPSLTRAHERSCHLDDLVAPSGRILPVAGDTEADLEVTPLTFFSSNPRFGRSCVHSGTKPIPRPAETSDTSENVSSQVFPSLD